MPNMVFVRCDATCLPFKPQTFSRVNCFGALHLFPDIPKSLAEIRRVMELSGCFYVPDLSKFKWMAGMDANPFFQMTLKDKW
jgi:Methylase involved in ubiquinone/menaquinone biosynthesis